ncbi:hypothetical protein F5Y17DRAFT_455885 [Xylariaceae sp. FL0594]|nr:hypothetical protein F5Y17DRAFT_455885 [Xylariaceae sp. FL0594]
MSSDGITNVPPAPRQKNCNSCVQAKRRCDRRTPTCSRCAEKMAPCVYISKSKTNSRPSRHGAASSHMGTSSLFPLNGVLDSPPLLPPVFSLDANYFHSIEKEFLPTFATGPLYQPPPDADNGAESCMDPLQCLISGNGSSSPNQWLLHTETEEVPRTQNPGAHPKALRTMAACADIKPWHAFDPTSTLYFVVNRVKGFVSELGARNALPFLHRYLYRSHTPECMVSCFATCLLYTSRTPANSTMVMQALYGNIGNLMAAQADRVVSTPIEKLARTQALLLYQIIRLFDGDVALRSQAEKDMSLFLTWVKELCNTRDNLDDSRMLGDFHKGTLQSVDWEKWIYAESVRRTVFMAFGVVGLFQLMKDPENIGKS